MSLMASGHYLGVVLPSLARGGEHEGIPVALVEAMAHGLPVITTPTGGIPELVSNNRGLLVAPGDATALASAVNAVAADPDLSLRLARSARQFIEATHDARTTAGILADWMSSDESGGL
jgi:glycosyltransferase involved in cell wall biosynthesis